MTLITVIAPTKLQKVAIESAFTELVSLPNFLKPSELSDESLRLPVLVDPELVKLAPFGPMGRVSSWKPELRHFPAIGSQLIKKLKRVSTNK